MSNALAILKNKINRQLTKAKSYDNNVFMKK